jgi:hypothetical protein
MRSLAHTFRLLDVNSKGDIVGVVGTNQAMGEAITPRNPSGFLRTREGDYFELKVKDASNTQVIGMNNARDVVGRYTVGTTTRGFVYRLKIENQRD